MNFIQWALLALLLIFITLRLTGQIDWSWLWVLSPLLGPLSLAVLGYLLQAIAWACMSEDERRRRRLASQIDSLAATIKRRSPN